MKIDTARLKQEELETIEKIVATSERRPRKKVFTKKWVYDHLDEGFKNFSYDSFDEVLDMVDTLYEIGLLIGVSKSRLKGDIVYHLVNEGFLEDWEKDNPKRLNTLLNKWGIKKKELEVKEE